MVAIKGNISHTSLVIFARLNGGAPTAIFRPLCSE